MSKLCSSLSAFLVAAFAMLAFAYFGAPLFASNKAYRDWRVRQTRPLADGISMQTDGIYISQDSGGIRLLRIWSCWLGGIPTDEYQLRASIRTTAEFKDGPEMPYWYRPLVPRDKMTDKTPFLWEFPAPKGSPEDIWLRVYFKRKSSSSDFETKKAKEEERWVDFDFPCFQAQDDTQPRESIGWRALFSTSK